MLNEKHPRWIQESLANAKEMHDSGACMKPHCEQNLSPTIPAIDIRHNDYEG